MRFVSGRVRGRLLPPVAALAVLLLAVGAANVAAAPHQGSVRDPVANLQLFSRSPVLMAVHTPKKIDRFQAPFEADL